jgi:hypothetical protein
MAQFRFRSSIEVLEDRSTPAASAFSDAVQTVAINSFIRASFEDVTWMANAKPIVQNFMTNVYAQSMRVIDRIEARGASGPMSVQVAGIGAMARMNAGFAQLIGRWLNFDVKNEPGSPPVTPPAVKPDAGMTDTIPDINATNWVTTSTGLKTWDVKVGTGDPVVAGDSITVFYTGWLLNGTVFDAKRSPATPATFALNGLIQGWQQGITGMRPGGIRRLYVPAALGYGAAGSPPNIPANADLVFEIKLVSHT